MGILIFFELVGWVFMWKMLVRIYIIVFMVMGILGESFFCIFNGRLIMFFLENMMWFGWLCMNMFSKNSVGVFFIGYFRVIFLYLWGLMIIDIGWFLCFFIFMWIRCYVLVVKCILFDRL